MSSPGRAQSLDPNLHFNFRWTNGPVRMKTSECARRPRRNLLSWVRMKLASTLFLLLGEKTRVAGRTSSRERMARTSGTITCWRKSSAQTVSVAPVEPTVLGPVEPTVNPMMLHRLKLHFNLIYVSTSSASRFHLHFLELSSSSIIIPHPSFLIIHHPSSSSFLVNLHRLIT